MKTPPTEEMSRRGQCCLDKKKVPENAFRNFCGTGDRIRTNDTPGMNRIL